MSKTLAAIGDLHACHEEMEILLDRLSWFSIDEIWSLGDLVDRGPDSGAVVETARKKLTGSVMGNHEESILRHWDRVSKGGPPPENEDKARTISQLTKEDADYLQHLPRIHIDDALGLVLVHGGVWPYIPFYKQPTNVVRCQMILPRRPGESRWWGQQANQHRSGRTEEDNRAEGYVRWYEAFDHRERCVYGHSVFTQPFLHQNPGAGQTIGIDTGSCFGGMLTAAIFRDQEEPFFVCVKAKKVWFEKSYRVHQED